MTQSINNKDQKRKNATIIAIIAVAIIAIIGFIFIMGSDGRALKKQLDLGYKFLTEQDYEQAIVAFKKAIEIDPMSVDAYLGLVDAYVGNGDFETAISTLEEAIKFIEDNGQDATVLRDKLTAVRMEQQVREEEEKLAAIPFVALHLDTIRNIALLKGKPILDYTRAELFNVGKSHCNYFDSEEWHRVENGETWPDGTPKPNTGVSARDDYFIEEKAYVSIRDVGITIIKSDSSFSLDGDNYVAWDMISYPYTGISDECESLIGTDLDDFLKTIGAPDANTIETTGMLLGDVEGTYLMGDVYSNGNLSITIQTKENDTTYRLTLDTEKMDGINKIKRIDFDIM